MTASKLDRQIQVRRAVYEDDGFGNAISDYADLGSPIWALKQDVSDTERFASGQVQATITTRFQVRSTPFTRAIDPADRITCEGRDYNIVGLKEPGQGRRQLIEITAVAFT